MKIYPAIDLLDGKLVRLTQGDYEKRTDYPLSPLEAAASFSKCGADCLHVVDLDGAREGVLSNFDTIRSITAQSNMFVQVGGGIRDEARVERYLQAGAQRVILGTAAIQNFAFLCDMVKRHGDQIALGVDAKGGFAATEGWQNLSDVDGLDFCKRARDVGLKTVIYTDIARDGMLGGANLGLYAALSRIEGLNVIASGGVSSLSDIRALRDLGLHGAIIGKALYAGLIGLSEAIAEAKEEL